LAERRKASGSTKVHSTLRQTQPERTVLVCCDFSARAKNKAATLAVRQARAAAQMSQFNQSRFDQQEDSTNPASSKLSLPTEDAFSAEVDELRELAASAGADVIDVILQRRDRPDPATMVGKGKLEEISALVASSQADLVVFQPDLTPSQLRELEQALPCRVIDRTQLILDIFAAHARTREGQLQVELAQLEYLLPRLTGRGRAMSQLGGGIGTRGPGETQLETDRRKIGRSILQLKKRLDAVRRTRRQQRQHRSSVPLPTVALVGYTNAGKSTLFNALTQAGVVTSSRMFATLDPTLRQLRLPSRRKVLLSDTVGFIRALPPTLVNAFRATLEEVQGAELLLHVMDAASPSLAMHRDEVEKVLRELNVDDKPCIPVMNKMDLLPAPEQVAFLAHADAIAVSARDKSGLDHLLSKIDHLLASGALASDPLEERAMMIPQSEGAILAALEADAIAVEKRFKKNNVHLRVRGPLSLLSRYRNFWIVGD
jgi:GTP-binding protein HflX